MFDDRTWAALCAENRGPWAQRIAAIANRFPRPTNPQIPRSTPRRGALIVQTRSINQP
jgi:hypothetical protein